MDNTANKIADLDKKVALIEQRLETIQNNHLHHIEEDIRNIKKYFLWAVGAVFAQLLTIIASLIFMM